MLKIILISAIAFAGLSFSSCNESGKTGNAQPEDLKAKNQMVKPMKNLVSIIEIPTQNFSRAVEFYQNLTGLKIEEVDMAGTKMGVFPGEDEVVNLTLVNGSGYKPSADGSVIYLNLGADLQPFLERVISNGGRVLVPKTKISADMGYYALFMDSEGNRIGLHSEG